MRITFPLLFSATLLLLFLCSCDNINSTEETTDKNEAVMELIEKSNPVTEGNLITKTKTDAENNIHIEYYDSVGNLVETYIWDNNETNIRHSITHYTQDNKIQKEETIIPADNYTVVTTYNYNGDGSLLSKTSSSYKDNRLYSTMIFDTQGELTEHTRRTYDNDLLKKTERFDKNDSLIEYSVYEYNDSLQMIKHSVFDKDGNIIKYTVFEYKNNLLISEKYYSSDNSLNNYNEYTYNNNGTKKSVISYDSDGNLLSENYF